MTPIHIAFAGYAGSGKDTAALRLIERGFKRVCFGDIIKRQIDPLVQQHLGFSAFTALRERKERIRPLLEHWGDANYPNIEKEFFSDLPALCVNTRLVRVREAQKWVAGGGIIIIVSKVGVWAATNWEHACLDELSEWGEQREGGVYGVLNYSTTEHLQDEVDKLVLANFPHYATLPIVPPVPADKVVAAFMADVSPCGLRTDGEWAGSDSHGVSRGTDL